MRDQDDGLGQAQSHEVGALHDDVLGQKLAQLEALFSRWGAQRYEGSRQEPVTTQAHALQCAQLAEGAGASGTLVLAALLHDIGHFTEGLPADGPVDDRHEMRAADWLAPAFGPEVTEPIRLHVQAKRWLVATDPAYRRSLSPASEYSLALQGGPLSAEACRAFERQRFADQAVLLRRWDDVAKQPGKPTASLAFYLALAESPWARGSGFDAEPPSRLRVHPRPRLSSQS